MLAAVLFSICADIPSTPDAMVTSRDVSNSNTSSSEQNNSVRRSMVPKLETNCTESKTGNETLKQLLQDKRKTQEQPRYAQIAYVFICVCVCLFSKFLLFQSKASSQHLCVDWN